MAFQCQVLASIVHLQLAYRLFYVIAGYNSVVVCVSSGDIVLAANGEMIYC